MSQNQNKQHFLHHQQQQQQQQLHHHQQQQQQHFLHHQQQQQHHHQQQQQWQQQYHQQQQQLHQQQQQQQQLAAAVSSAAAHRAHVASTSSNVGVGGIGSGSGGSSGIGGGGMATMSMYAGGGLAGGNVGGGGCLYDSNAGIGVSNGGGGSVVGGSGFDLDMVGHAGGSAGAGASGGGGVGYVPHVNAASAIGGYGTGITSAAVSRDNVASNGAAGCAYAQHTILPPECIKMEPLEQILTPTIEMDELIIKTEPSDDAYNKVSMVDEAMHSASYMNYPKHLQNYPHQLLPQIKIEGMSAMSQQKPLHFPRRKMQTERSDTLPICQRCKAVFFKKQTYTRHVAQSTCDIVEYDFKCSICPMSFMSSEELLAHEHLHRVNMYFCHKYCGKYFDSIELCEVHEYMHHDYANFVCNVCSTSFPTRESLFAHMPQHRQHPRFDCPVCRLWFHTPMELHQHRLAAPYFCGKFYHRRSSHANMPHGSPFRSMPPPPHSASYNLQDCRMGVMEVPSTNNFSTFLQNRAYHHHQQQQQQQHHQQQQQQHHQPLSLPPPLPPPPATNADFMRSNSCSDFQMPHIKTEIKIEHDIFGTSDYQLQSTLPPPPPIPPPPLPQQSPSSQPSRQSSFNDFLNDSFGNTQSSHQSLSSNNSSGAAGANDFFSSGLQNSNSTNNFSIPNAPVSRTRVVDHGEDSAVCCVPKCGVRKNTSPTLQFFTFPKDEKFLHQWLYNLKMLPEPQTDYAHYRICSLHFPKRCINRYSLCYWAVPTFNLGHDDVANLYQNREITNTFTVGERAQCSMPGCQSQRGESNCKFYNFPNDMKTRIKWCQNARLPVHCKEPRHFCSRHFEDRCFGKFRLKPWAVPTLHLGTAFGKIHDNPGVFNLEEKKCCLPHCRRTRSSDFNLSLYRFPRDEVLLQRWCYNLRLDPSVYRGKNHKICSAHFIKEALGLRKLSPGAVPTLNLGHNDTFNIYENELPTPPPLPASKMFNFHNATAPVTSKHASNQDYSSLLNTSSIKFSISSITSSVASSTSAANIYDTLDICFVPSCKRTRLTDNVTLHTIPRRPEQMKKWCHNLKLNIETLHKGVRICSAHFETYCIGGCMRPFAVPTLNLGHDDPNIYKNPDVIKKLNIRETCCVQQCKRNRDRDHANLHRFPSNPVMLRKWCENLLKLVPDGTKLFNDAICEVHFEDRCLRNKRLEKWAVPTVNLGHDEEPAHRLPTEEEVADLYVKPIAPNNGDEDGECCVETCRRDPKIDDIKLYRPPEDPEILAKWAYNLQVETPDLMSLRICNLHFESQCIGKRLHSWAIPTLNLASRVENLYENPEPLHTMKVRRERRILQPHEPAKPWMPRCCLSHCRKMRHIDNVQLFRFPVLNRSMLAKWCHNLQLPLVGNGHRRLCSTHFDPDVLTKRCPMPQSVPTIDLNTPPGYKIYQNPARLKLAKLRLERVCIIPSCRRTRADGVQLFRFPHNRAMLRKWCHNTHQRPNEALRAQYRVCSQHFEPHSFGVKRLMPGAIPTLNLDSEVADVYPNEAQSFAETQCVVNDCEATKELDGARLFKFPCDDEDALWKWCNNLKMNPIDCRGVRICNRHFEPECIGPKMLYKWAIPTLELGHSDAEIELVPIPRPEERYTEIFSKCCVPNCGKSRKYDDAQMNSFPKNSRLFRIWKHNLKLDYLDFKEREKYKICNDHFEPICVGKLRLNYGAIPTINLGHDDTDDLYPVQPKEIQVSLFGKTRPLAEHEMSKDSVELDMSEMHEEIQCSFPDCNATKGLLREAYDMPTHKVLLMLWCTEMKADAETLNEMPKLCGLHFIDIYKTTLDAAAALVDTHDEDDAVAAELKTLAEVYASCCDSPTVRSAQCSVIGCSINQLSTEHKLYPFPCGNTLTEKWRFNIDIDPTDLLSYLHKVCALHFETRCFTAAKRLRPWAIPTLQLQRDTSIELHKIPELGSAERPYEMQCCALQCAREKADCESMKLYSFPIFAELLEKWLHNLQLERDLCARFRVCEQHFELRCFVGTRLLPWAIPTLKLGHTATDIHENEPPSAANVEEDDELSSVPNVKMKKSLDIVKCCVPSCRRSRLQHGVRLFEFPRGNITQKKWCHNLQLPPDTVSIEQLRICCLHFHKRCIDGKQLHAWAKPTKLLGHNMKIYENPKNVPGSFQPKCCLPHCGQQRTMDNNLRTFGFPKDNTLLRKWCANLRMRIRDCHGRICVDHFPPEAIGHRKLRAGAVPTLNLGYDERPIYNNKMLAQMFLGKETNDRELRSDKYVQRMSDDEVDAQSDADDDYMYEDAQDNVEATHTDEDDAEAENSVVGTDDFYSNYDYNEASCAAEDSEDIDNDDSKDAEIDDDDVEMIMDNENGEDSSFNVACDPLDFVECIEDNEVEDSAVATTPVVNTEKRDLSKKRANRSSIVVEDFNIENSNATSSTYASGDAAASPVTSSVLITGCKEKLYPSVFRLCCLKHCRRKKTPPDPPDIETQPHVRTFAFPKDDKLLRMWCENLQLSPADVRNRRICDGHFEPEVMGRVKLIRSAVPTLDLGPNQPKPKHKNSRKLQTNVIKHDITKCIVPNCGRGGVGLPLYPFPRAATSLRKWCDNVGLSPKHSKHYRICKRHFEPHALDGRRLRVGAKPTLHLGQKLQVKQQKIKEEVVPGQRCCIKTCHKTSEDDQIRLYPFPTNYQLLRKWCHNTKQPLQSPEERRYVCSNHFVQQALLKKFLCVWAVPTVDLGHMGVIFENPPSYIQSAAKNLCCLQHCNSGRNEKLFSFPKRGALLRKWAHNTQQDAYTAQCGEFQLCAAHFDSSCFTADGELTENAVPTQNLGHERLDIYTPLEEYSTANDMDLCCVVPQCGRTVRTHVIKCFPFPKDEEELKKWCHNLQLEAAQCRNAYICNLHFEAGCVSKQKLLPSMVPTLFLGHTNESLQLYENCESAKRHFILTDHNRCCVKDCGKSHYYDGVTLNRFPQTRSLYLMWTHNLKLAPNNRVLHAYKVCSEHFEEECKVKRQRLKIGALPTLKLGHDDTNIYHNKPTILNGPKKSLKRKASQHQNCVIKDCNVAKYLHMQLYALPEDEVQFRDWCAYLKLNAAHTSHETTHLCALHFVETYKFVKSVKREHKVELDDTDGDDELRQNYESILNSTRIQLLKCCVAGCETKFTDNIKLIQFPKGAEQCAKWQHNTKVTFASQQRYLYKVCALHFESCCFGNARLRFWSVPTLRLPSSVGIHQNPAEFEFTEKCCVKECLTNIELANASTNATQSDPVRLWNFPKDSDLNEKWCQNLALTDVVKTNNLKICSRHFEPYCFGKMLRVWAIPTLHLNTELAHIHENPQTEMLYFSCCIATCRQLRDDDAGIKLYKFPKRESLFEKWVHNVRMDPDTCRFSRICTLHFEKHCLTPMIQPWALPTLDLGHNETDLFRNPKIKLNTYHEKCCLPHCGKVRHQHNVKLFSFPKDEAVLAKWWHNLRITRQEVRNRKICGTHFEPICIGMRGLKTWAVPTHNLGHNAEDILPNPTPNELIELEKSRRPHTPQSNENEGNSAVPTTPTQRCAINSCQRTDGKYRFPKLDWLLQKWCDNTHISLEEAAHAKICAIHFELHVMGKLKPRPWALPTLELGHNDSLHPNPKQLARFHPEEHKSGEVKFVRDNHCAIISCMKSKSDGVQLFKYPNKGRLLRKWAENCKHYAYQARRYAFRICSEHFEPNCFNSVRLRVGAVPTLKLGHDETNIHRSELNAPTYGTASPICGKMEKCSVPECGRTKLVDNVRLYKFPENADTCEKWCYNLRMDMSNAKDALVCNMHFEERCISGRRVLIRALPTLLLGHTDLDDIYENPESFKRPETVVRCCVPDCGKSKTEDDVLMSAFPKNRSSFEKWAHNLKLPTTSEVWHTYKVCSEHFESYCHEYGRVKFGAIPTLKLGHNDPDIYQVSEDTVTFFQKRKRDPPVVKPAAPTLSCCHPDCNEINSKLVAHVFKLPKLAAVRQRWCDRLGLGDDEMKKLVAEDEGEPTLCPLHFKVLYDENIDILNELEQSTALQEDPSIAQCWNDLRDQYATVSDLSCVRKVTCSVPGCSSNYLTSPATLYQFPHNRELLQKWCHNTNVNLDENRRYCFKVCELHFEPDCVGENSKRLKSSAIPTLNLPDAEARTIYQNLQRDALQDRRSALMHAAAHKCCIATCVHANSGLDESGAIAAAAADASVQFFNFPNEAELLYKWLHNTQMSMFASSNARICSLHFEKYCFNKRLRANAVPTLLLGHERTDIYTNPEELAPSKRRSELGKELLEAVMSESNEFDRDTSRHCRIVDCTSHAKFADVKLYRFPQADDQFRKWLHNTQLDVDKTKLWRYRICHRHFEPVCLKFKKLPVGTMPTLNLGPQRPAKIYENEFSVANLKNFKVLDDTREESVDTSTFIEDSTDFDATANTQLERTTESEEISNELACAVPSCESKYRDVGIQLYRLPQNPELRHKWLANCHLDEAVAQGAMRMRICTLHFTSHCFYGVRRHLRFGAVPTLRLGHTDPNVFPDGFTQAEKTTKAAVEDVPKTCCVRNCKTSKLRDTRFFAFPENKKVLGKWLANLQMEYDTARPSDYNICEWHFPPNSIKGGQLDAEAVPCLNMQTAAHAGISEHLKAKVAQAAAIADDERPTTSAAAAATVTKAAASATTTSDGYNDVRPGARKCCLAHCQKHMGRDNVRMFKFPTIPEQLEKWLHNLHIKFDCQRPWLYSICSDHFAEHCVLYYENKSRLFRWALPTLKLGPKAPTILFTNAHPKMKLKKEPADKYLGQESVVVTNNPTANLTLQLKHERDDEMLQVNAPDMDLLEPIEKPPQLAMYEDDEQYSQYEDNSLLDVIREETSSLAETTTFYTTQLVRAGWGTKRHCCLPHCMQTRGSGVRLFRFPLDQTSLQRWEHNLRTRFQEKQRNTHLICSDHFEPHLFNKRLVYGALPTLKLGHDGTDVYQNGVLEEPGAAAVRDEPPVLRDIAVRSSSQYVSKKSLLLQKPACNVPGCDRSTTASTVVRLYPFPNNKAFMKIWVERTQIAYDLKSHAEIRVCDAHFEPDCTDINGLKSNAVPTLCLPMPVINEAAISSQQPTVHGNAVRCSVPGCGNSTAMRDIKMFSKFPDDFELFTKWCFNLKVDPRTYVDGTYHVCSAHFEHYCIGGHNLREWAVPTLRLGHASKLIHCVERPAEAEIKCCLPHCGRKKSKDGVEFFNFPKGDLYKIWCQILKLDEGLYRNTNKRICSAHFNVDSYNSVGCLKTGACPTLLLRNRTANAAAHILKPPPYRSKCIVRTCHEMQLLYNFPEKRSLCTKWCHNLKIDYYPKLHQNANFKICRRHFETHCLAGGRLHPEAVPTVQLGHNDTNIYQNTVRSNTSSYDDNSSMRTSVSTVHTWLMDVEAETNVTEVEVDTETTATAAGAAAAADVNMVANMRIEEETYYADFEEQQLLPHSTFVAADGNEVIDLDAAEVQQEIDNWQGDAVDDDTLLWPLN